MKPILGKPMVEQMIERVMRSRYVKEVTIATTNLPDDQPLFELAQKNGISCYRGSAEDVLERITEAAHQSKADLIVELLGDNPLVHADLIDEVIEFYQSGSFDYVANVTTEYPHAGSNLKKFPTGIRVQVFPVEILEQCEIESHTPYHRENSTTYIYENPEFFRLVYLEAKGRWESLNRPELTFAVNYQKNFDLVSYIFETAYPNDPNFSLSEVMKIYDSNPTLKDLMGK